MSRSLFKFGSIIFVLTFIIIAIDYSGKVAKEKRYKQYESESVRVETILAWQSWNKSLLSKTESINILFRKDWIPVDMNHDVNINQVIKKVGNTNVIIEKAYRQLIQGDDEVVMMVNLEQATKKLQGSFLIDSIFDNGWSDLPVNLTFYHLNKLIEVESYSYGTGDRITVSLPIEILERYDYEIEVVLQGLALYEYNYIGT
ncbi:hypothetical protein Back11_57980 [Paenibacillus baekrokdamisoli]|uniref:Uncharacterized protein n=1 Tax=Paenibacillus baekrokdamisoli TaxID=1712516 RepID=A0A3G9JHK2_9BACL|nr:hypothetical protein [Paenibacillus baekrokdamisoli]MBB3072895.1 hypothetical protein [Paenibacillus baekrokdamisoli]BBH24453.1 hypothetical protein Back11_57980 [Paenibacillus baekrokdamisoli]